MKTIYWAVKLTNSSRDELLKAFLPVHNGVFAEHMTIAFKPSEIVDAKFMGKIGENIKINIIGYAEDDMGQAVLVSSNLDNDVNSGLPHITISCADGIKPTYSKKMKYINTSGPILEGTISRFTGKGWM